MKPIVIISGPVGAGKSTVSKELVKNATEPTAYIEGDAFWSFIVKSDERELKRDVFKPIMRSMMAASLPLARADYEVILDFSIPPWFLQTAKAIASFREVPLDYVILKPSESICAERASQRSVGTIADYSEYSKFYETFADFDQFTIANDALDPVSTADKIREGLVLKRFRVP